MQLRTSLLALVVLLALCAGCTPKPELPLEAAAQFSDVAAPDGFELSRYSFAAEATTVRAGMLRYTGKMGIPAVVAFYRKVMPQLGWELYKEDTSSDIRSWLYFRKENTVCVVLISRRMHKTHIQLELR